MLNFIFGSYWLDLLTYAPGIMYGVEPLPGAHSTTPHNVMTHCAELLARFGAFASLPGSKLWCRRRRDRRRATPHRGVAFRYSNLAIAKNKRPLD